MEVDVDIVAFGWLADALPTAAATARSVFVLIERYKAVPGGTVVPVQRQRRWSRAAKADAIICLQLLAWGIMAQTNCRIDDEFHEPTGRLRVDVSQSRSGHDAEAEG
jgi:hypothetical protein